MTSEEQLELLVSPGDVPIEGYHKLYDVMHFDEGFEGHSTESLQGVHEVVSEIQYEHPFQIRFTHLLHVADTEDKAREVVETQYDDVDVFDGDGSGSISEGKSGGAKKEGIAGGFRLEKHGNMVSMLEVAYDFEERKRVRKIMDFESMARKPWL
jgi:hypothetical protein